MFKWWKSSRAPEGVTEPVVTIAKTFWEEGRWGNIELLSSERSDFIYNNVSRRYQLVLEDLWSDVHLSHSEARLLMSDFIQDTRTGLILCVRPCRPRTCPSEDLGMTDREEDYLCEKWQEVIKHKGERERLQRRKKLSRMYERD